jgi:hypothetical protein
MESKLEELLLKLTEANGEHRSIEREQRLMEEEFRDKKDKLKGRIYHLEEAIKRLRNELGKEIVLTETMADNLRTELKGLDDILHNTKNDESRVTLSYECPVPNNNPYSIHMNIIPDSSWSSSIKLDITIKTKCTAVERIVREILMQVDGMEHYRREEDKISDEERVRWCISRHNELRIHFNHDVKEVHDVVERKEQVKINPLVPLDCRLALIEETAMLQNDTPPEEFVEHCYMNRYERLKGVVKSDFDDLRHSIHTALDESFGRNSGAFPSLREQNPVAWSMNWYRLRDNSDKMWALNSDQKTAIVADFEDLRISYPFDAQIHIFQIDDRDVLLVAMCLQLRQ